MKKAYVIMEKGFEYNDEIYSPSEGGHPSKIFFTKNACDKEVEKQSIMKVMQEEIEYYYYDIEDICDDPGKLLKFCESLNDKYGIDPKKRGDNKYALNKSATFKEAKEYYDMIHISFYEVVEVEIDQQDMRESKISEVLS